MAIVLVHRVACSEQEFLSKLFERFQATHDSKIEHPSVAYEEGKLVVMRHKICSIILVWLRDFYLDFSDHRLASMLKSFLGMQEEWYDQGFENGLRIRDTQGQDLDWSNLVLVKDVMCRVFEDRLSILQSPCLHIKEPRRVASDDSDRTASSVPTGQSDTTILKDGLGMPNKPCHLLQLDKTEVAQQLTLMESKLFYEISYADLLRVGEILGYVCGAKCKMQHLHGTDCWTLPGVNQLNHSLI